MIKENVFDGRRLFTTTAPTDYSIKQIGTQDFARSTKHFLDECFRGAISLDIDSEAFGYVEISVRGFAYLIKLILSKIYGKSVLTATLSFTKKRVIFSIDFGVSADECDLCDTAAVGERCGLISEIEGSVLNFYANIKPSTLISLYARDSMSALAVYNEVFYL